VIAGIDVDVRRDAVWLRSEAPLGVLGSAVVGGELDTTRDVVNMHVAKGYRGADPAADLRAFARGLGITQPFVGLMTAARTHEAQVVSERADGASITVVATVGLAAPAAAGVTLPVRWQPSTINVVAVVDADLDRAAAINGVITVTEAKVAALVEARVVTADGAPATGTVTDAVVLLWTGRGARLPYLGPGTTAGWGLARAVRRAVGQGIRR
jgi:adenosylcobinamide hydrolase